MNDRIYGQILFNCRLSNEVKLKLGYNLKIFSVDMRSAAVKKIAEYVFRPAKIIPASCIKARCVHLLIIIHGL